uniref:Uncharacterized protein n=1 Tax=Setaria digitata TaxID=48799 RepID=A0A915PH57_9BILA
MDEFFKIKSEVNAALYNADMKIIASKMCQLIVLGEEYINEMEEKSKIPNCLLLRNIAAYMISLLKAFGIIPKNFDNAFAIDSTETVICGISPSTSAQEIIMPYVSALTVFRKTISELAQQHNVTDIIKECDRIRDKVLPELGIILNEANPEEPVLINVSALKHWKIDGDNNTNKERERE